MPPHPLHRPRWLTRRLSSRPYLLGGCLLLLVGSTHFVRLNLSPSVPLGLYTLHALPTPLTPGLLVVLPTPALVRRWVSWPASALLKPVAAVAGEEVCVEDGTLVIRGWDYGPVYHEAGGTALPHLDEGCQTVPEGMVFLASQASRSLDSRYFGPIRTKNITARAMPFFTWKH